MDKFWNEEHGGYFVLGTDRGSNGQLRQLAIKTSNMGHLLHSRFLQGNDEEVVHRREAVIRQLFSKEMFGVNGIMTLASDEIRYRPGAYHNGSVWPWDNYIIAQGLEMHGYYGLTDHLEQTLLGAIDSTHRFVEYLRGGDDPTYRLSTRIVDVQDSINGRINRLEQPPQDMQAWTTAAVLSIKLDRQRHRFTRLAMEDRKRDLETFLLGRLPVAPPAVV